MNWYIIAHLAISPSKKSEQPDTSLKVLPIGRTSLHHCLPFRDVPERGCGAAALHFLVVPVYHAEPCINQAWVLFLCQLWVWPWGLQCRLGERKQCVRSGDYGHLGHFFMELTCALRDSRLSTKDSGGQIICWRELPCAVQDVLQQPRPLLPRCQ